MSNSRSNALQPVYRVGLRLECECSFEAVRGATLFARDWLASHQLPISELDAWELALVEAGNNAVEHAPEERLMRPIVYELSLSETEVEARITDHTTGFDFPEQIDLPDFESEGGRGLFLIKSLTDHSVYLRGNGENQLVLRKRRATATPIAEPGMLALQRQLAESEIAVNEMSEELASSYESLVAVFRYSAELGTNASLADFASRLLVDLLTLTESDAAVLRLFQESGLETFLVLPAESQPNLPSLSGRDAAQSVEVKAAETREDEWFGSKHPLPSADPLRAIPGALNGLVHAFESGDQQLGTIAIIRCRDDTPHQSAQVNILHTLIDFLAIQIVNARMLDERTQLRITRRELEIGADIQRSLLPESLPSAPPFQLAASCSSAHEVGGDFYDVLRVGDEGLLLVIADVMGKGVAAALFATVLRSAVRSMPALFSNPAQLLTSVNRTLCADLSRVDMFVTAQAVFLDTRRKRLVAASAGHCPLLCCQPGDTVAAVADDAGLPLGIVADTEYAQTTNSFPNGSVALLYTDGITESQDLSGNLYGIERLEKRLPTLASKSDSAANLSDKLLAELDSFRAGAPLTDDQTFLILRHAL